MSIPQINSIARLYALVLGSVLLLIGILGWIPSLTPNGELLGLFGITFLHNVAHTLTGITGILIGLFISDRSARFYTATMCLVYGALATLGFLEAALLQVLNITLADNILHTAIFALSLIVYVGAIMEQRTLDQLAGHAQTFRSNQGRTRKATYATAARGSNNNTIEQLDFAQISRNQWGSADKLEAGRITGSNDFPMMTNFASPSAASNNNGASLLEERIKSLENEVRNLKQQVSRIPGLEAEVMQLRNGFGIGAPPSRPASFTPQPPAAAQIPAYPLDGYMQSGGNPFAANGWSSQPQQQNRVAPRRPPAPAAPSGPDLSNPFAPPPNADNSWLPDGRYGAVGTNSNPNPFDQQEWPKL